MTRDPAAEYFGRALASVRSERGLKRMQLKELSGLSYPYISEIENGGKYPSRRAIQSLSDALGMSPSELLSRADRIESDDAEGREGIDANHSYVAATSDTRAQRAVLTQRSEADALFIDRLSEQVLRAIEGPLNELVIREVQMTVREELLRQRDGQ